MTAKPQYQSRLAAIVFDQTSGIDALLKTVVHHLKMSGLRVAGYLQCEELEPGSCTLHHIESISDGHRICISQPLGAGSRGCRLDPRGLAEASGHLVGEIDESTDLLILNRFGKGEADGQGLRTALERAFEMQVPVLTAVRALYYPAWEAFAGELATTLKPDLHNVLAWCANASNPRHRSDTSDIIISSVSAKADVGS